MKYFVAVVISLALGVPLCAQQGRGTIQGAVTDSSGAAVQGVAIRVANDDTNLAFVTATNGDGYYSAPNLNVGPYTVTAGKPGFRKTVRSGLVLQVDQRAQIDLQMEIAHQLNFHCWIRRSRVCWGLFCGSRFSGESALEAQFAAKAAPTRLTLVRIAGSRE